MKDEIKFNLNEDIIMQIEMASYMEYNSSIASINEHLGEIYGYSDLKDAEEAQLHYEKELAYKAIQKLQEENKKLKHDLEQMYNDTTDTYNEICAEQIDYKSRNGKAIEYIIDNCILSDVWKDLGFCNLVPIGIIEYKQLSKTKIKNLLNILQGSDKDEKEN